MAAKRTFEAWVHVPHKVHFETDAKSAQGVKLAAHTVAQTMQTIDGFVPVLLGIRECENDEDRCEAGLKRAS